MHIHPGTWHHIRWFVQIVIVAILRIMWLGVLVAYINGRTQKGREWLKKRWHNLERKWMTYSAIHKAAGSLVTGRSQKNCWLEHPPEVVPASSSHWQPMDTFLFHRNCTSWNHGTAGNPEAGGSVNSAVRVRTILGWRAVLVYTHTHIYSWRMFLVQRSRKQWNSWKSHYPYRHPEYS